MNSSDILIRVENISKRYRIGLKEKIHDSFGAAVFDFIKSPLKNYRTYRSLYKFDDVDVSSGRDTNSNPSDIIWALRDVSFQVKRGEVVGIIGRNGAGKSTLLKILCRITDPTSGHAEIRGRISSLLEVGTGFHQELTGRENVYLNGTVLGMSKREVDQKFDEIVDFSGVEKFLDTPVKRYSSGMKVRLAFSVAAHLEPELLLVDEVLAVGDARFQKKCLDKMQDVRKEGRTVLFVSHNMSAINRLCGRTIFLSDGRVAGDGPSNKVVATYLNSEGGTAAARKWDSSGDAPSGEVARLCAVRVRNEDGEISQALDIRKPFEVEMEYDVIKSGYVLLPHFHFFNEEAVHVFAALDQDPNWRERKRPEGRYSSTVSIPGNFLAEGTLSVHCNLITLNPNIPQFSVTDQIAVQIIDSIDGDSARGEWTGELGGVVRPLLEWRTAFEPKVNE